MTRSLRIAIALLSFALAVHAAQTRGVTVRPAAGTEAAPEIRLYDRMYAVVIGIDRYPKLAKERQLRYAVNDARGVASLLKSRFAFDEVIALYDDKATKAEIERVLISDLGSRVTEEDAVFIFFAGHGMTTKTKYRELGWILPHDGSFKPEERASNISMERIKSEISTAIQAKHIFYVFDACYGGLLLTRGAEKQAPPRDPAYLRSITKEDVRQVLTAGTDKQEVLDGDKEKGHSIFTSRLLEKLGSVDDYVTASELSVWIRERVVSDAVARGHEQTPTPGVLWGFGDFVFVPKQRPEEEAPEPAGAQVPVPAIPAPAPVEAPTVPAAPPAPTGGIPSTFTPVGDARDPSGLPMRMRHIATGYELVLVSAGEFTMGAEGAGPPHKVMLDAYYIGATEVTNGQYRAFDPEHNSKSVGGASLNNDRQPAVKVSWEEAKKWCAWAGLELPTEAQWEKAARGADERRYPWGNDYAASNVNFSGDRFRVTAPVGSYPKGASPYGCLDMAGSVWEWCEDWYDPSYYGNSPGRNPRGPDSGSAKVVRGGAWNASAMHLRSTTRHPMKPQDREFNVGFRAVWAPAGVNP